MRPRTPTSKTIMLRHAAPSTKPKNSSSSRYSFARTARSSILPIARQTRNVNAAAKRILATCICLSFPGTFLETDGVQKCSDRCAIGKARRRADIDRYLDDAAIRYQSFRDGPTIFALAVRREARRLKGFAVYCDGECYGSAIALHFVDCGESQIKVQRRC